MKLGMSVESEAVTIISSTYTNIYLRTDEVWRKNKDESDIELWKLKEINLSLNLANKALGAYFNP